VAINGHNGNGNGNGHKWNATKEVFSFIGAESISIGAATVAYTFMDDLAPSAMKRISRVVSKTCIEPFLDTIEKGLTRCSSKDCKPDFTKSRQERAEQYAHYITRFGISAAISVGTEWGARNLFNHALKVKEPASNLAVTCLDKGLHLGLIIGANTVAAKQTDTAIDITSNVLQKSLNWPKDRADRLADVTWRWEAANWISAFVTSGYIFTRQVMGRGNH